MLGLLRSLTLEAVLWLAGSDASHTTMFLFDCLKEHEAPEMAVADSH